MEFDLIGQYFQRPFTALWQQHAQRWPGGLNNDCAGLQLQPGERLWTSTDTLVEGVHWFSGHAAHDVGWKALACNVSDLMACGAQPVGFVLALSLPAALHCAARTEFLQGFSDGLLACAQHYQCPLVGGDTTTAPAACNGVVITLTVFGVAAHTHTGFPRYGAVVGDGVWVSGLPGLARLGLLCQYQQRGLLSTFVHHNLEHHLALLQTMPAALRQDALLALHRPRPPVALGLALQGQANAALDLSDGLAGDLAHIARASQCQVVLDEAALLGLWQRFYPDWLAGLLPLEQACLLEGCLVGGDDYQLCWTQTSRHQAPDALSAEIVATCVGFVQAGQGVHLLRRDGLVAMPFGSYQHFSG